MSTCRRARGIQPPSSRHAAVAAAADAVDVDAVVWVGGTAAADGGVDNGDDGVGAD